jgi:hypothetical protein
MPRLILVSAAVGVLCFAAGVTVAADQPNMYAALSALQQARQYIVAADQYHDHGGHAGNATALIDQAIHEVHLGINYRNNHGP